MAANPLVTSLRTLATHNARQARAPQAAALYRQQRASLAPIRYRLRVRPRVNRFAPRGIVSNNEWMFDQVLRPVIGVDIDGTLGEWHETFLRFAEMYLQKKFPEHYDGTVSLAQFMKVTKPTYRRVKLAFRQSGLKRAMAPLPGAVEMARHVRQLGAELWVCTTRPYLRLDNIDPDTRWWLHYHRIRFDGVLFGEKKWNDLKSVVGGRVLGIIDDLPDQVQNAQTLALPATMLTRRYNQYAVVGSRVDDLYQAKVMYHDLICEFKEKRNVRGQ